MRLLFLISLFSFVLEAATGYNRPLSNWHINQIQKQIKQQSDIHTQAVDDAFYYYKRYRHEKNLSQNYLAIADYTKISKQKRLYIIDLHTGKIHRFMVAHGENSGAKGGRVWRSSNKLNTHMTPHGFFRVGIHEGITTTKKYPYLSVTGLQWSNRKVGLPTRQGGRDIIVHTANYVNWEGRSQGCFAIRPQDKWSAFPKLKQALLYSYTGL